MTKKSYVFRKSLVITIIVCFVGASVTPSISGNSTDNKPFNNYTLEFWYNDSIKKVSEPGNKGNGDIIYDNGMENCGSSIFSQLDMCYSFDIIGADDFSLSASNTSFNSVHWIGLYCCGPIPGYFDMEVTFYDDDGSGNKPGDVINSY